MASTRTTRRRFAVVAIVIVFGRVGVAIIAAAASLTSVSPVPTPNVNAEFEAFKTACSTTPFTYAIGAVRGVYQEQVVPGSYVDQICSLYGSPTASLPTGAWLRDYTRRDCIQTAGGAELPAPAPAITGRPGASLGSPLVNPPIAPDQWAR
jgi:hypothetical protein